MNKAFPPSLPLSLTFPPFTLTTETGKKKGLKKGFHFNAGGRGERKEMVSIYHHFFSLNLYFTPRTAPPSSPSISSVRKKKKNLSYLRTYQDALTTFLHANFLSSL